ncbi:MAG: hypothetical protein U9O20_03080 [Patescibacteria group bacterium]|nr:hypothetical protein [Patescibacteria group bacterium]
MLEPFLNNNRGAIVIKEAEQAKLALSTVRHCGGGFVTHNPRGGSKRNLALGTLCGNSPNNTAPLSPSLRYGEPQKTKFAFSFFKKIGGAKKRIKTQRQILIFVGSLQSFPTLIL